MLLGNTLLDVDVHTQGLAPLALPACVCKDDTAEIERGDGDDEKMVIP